MPRKSEETLASWTQPASDAEQERYEWTKGQIENALGGRSLDQWSYRVYPKGSYPNNTNVVRDSDVDIAVELTGLRNHEFIHAAEGMTLQDFGLQPYTGDYSVRRFKDDVEAALIDHFGGGPIDRGDKAIHVRETSRGLRADVVACQTFFSHTGRFSQRQGIVIHPDSGGEIHNFPKQHLDEGVRKNEATNRRYKRVVRILKRLENEMVDRNVISVVPSFLIESLVWNVPTAVFTSPTTWTERVTYALGPIYLYANNAEPSTESERWLEANGVKFLFYDGQAWSREQAREFAYRAFDYLELG
jgi:hypothetical protein